MSDTYQAVYDAVRSRINPFNGSDLIDSITRQFDFSFYANILYQNFLDVAFEQMRPSVLLKPSLSIDGNQWCALYGDNLQDGVVGFGDTPAKAMLDFDKQYNTFDVKNKKD